MNFKLRQTTFDELILLHDFYHESPEPDAPKQKFADLDKAQQDIALAQFPVSNYQSFESNKRLLGFIGFFPDDDLNINIFYVLSPQERAKGQFSKLITLAIEYGLEKFPECQNLRALTRKQNTFSIKGLERACFVRRGSLIEEVQPDIIYEEYILPLK